MQWTTEALHEVCIGAKEEITDIQKIRQHRIDQLVKERCLGEADI